VWHSHTIISHFPWPLPQDKLWVETNTAFHQDLLIIRSFTLHELGQIIDLRSDWLTALVQIVWKLNDGALPSLRLLAEIDIIGGVWLLSQQSNLKAPELDFCCNRPLWLSDSPKKLSDPEQDERLTYFGWVRDPSQTEVSTATKGDDAKVDLSLWAVGSNGNYFERARKKIRDFLFIHWTKLLKHEALMWLSLQDSKTRDKDQVDISECITRAANSNWWEWKDCSRLFFWRWPVIWQDKACNRAQVFHNGFRQPCLNFRSPPIKEEWIRKLGMIKL
jgi:hypothetical protein